MQQPQISFSPSVNGLRRFTTAQAVTWYLGIAICAAVADGLSKSIAISLLSDHTMLFGSRFALMLVFNTAGAGGMSWGEHTWLLNVILTGFSVLMISGIVIQLARVDARAAISLGLVAGGATGNLISMLFESAGVADFVAFRMGPRAIVCNVADIALWSGALLLIPVVRSLVRAIRVERVTKQNVAFMRA